MATRIVLPALAVLGVSVAVTPCAAGVLTVPPGGGTLQAAIDSASPETSCGS